MSLELETQALADHLPNGRVFEAKNIQDSNFRALLRGVAGALLDVDEKINEYGEEFNPAGTTLFLEEWEAALGLPDECFGVSGTIEERRQNVVVKLAASGVQTETDFVRLAELFGVNINIKTGTEIASFPLTFPIIFMSTPSDGRYMIVVEHDFEVQNFFPYTFPIIFGDKILSVLTCLFQKLKPVNTQVIFRNVEGLQVTPISSGGVLI